MHRFALLLALVLIARSAAAEDPPFSDLHGREPVVRDLVPRIVPVASGTGQAALSVRVGLRQTEERRDLRGGIVLSLPTDRFVDPSLGAEGTVSEGTSSAKAKERLEGDGGSAPEEDGDAPPASPGAPGGPRPVSLLPLIRPRDARAAISAAQARFGVAPARDRLDDLGTRARWSGLMPRLRLRTTRRTNEAVSFSPTSYDDDRTTSKGGASLWLEARATWDLDRLVFASEELRVERLRRKLAGESAEIASEVLELLVQWQGAARVMYEPLVEPQECLRHALSLEEATLRLDWLTEGWFSDWRAEHPLPRGSCMDPEPVEG